MHPVYRDAYLSATPEDKLSTFLSGLIANHPDEYVRRLAKEAIRGNFEALGVLADRYEEHGHQTAPRFAERISSIASALRDSAQNLQFRRDLEVQHIDRTLPTGIHAGRRTSMFEAPGVDMINYEASMRPESRSYN